MKRCRRCDETKPLDDFYRRPANTDGHDNRCKACERARACAYHHRTYEEKADRRRLASRERYKANPERMKKQATSWAAKNPEKRRAHKKKWKLANPNKVAAGKEHRGLNLLNSHIAGDEAGLAAKYRDKPRGMQVDHIVPILGKDVSGLDVSWNIQYLSPRANSQKGNRVIPGTELAATWWNGGILPV